MTKKITVKPAADKQKKQQDKGVQQQHPYETDSQVQNRYGSGRKHSGSDGTQQDSRGSNH